jgi:L-cysteine:1D-myo-inositol 2-amino-2-deoxy-alpha-D-glucopyranoside ligase
MESLSVIPPDHYVAATEVIAQVSDAVRRLLDRGTAYRVADDIYFDTASRSGDHLDAVFSESWIRSTNSARFLRLPEAQNEPGRAAHQRRDGCPLRSSDIAPRR